MKRLSLYPLLLTLLLAAQACKKDDNAAPTAPTLEAYLAANPNLSMFAQALDKAELQTFKNGQGPFTWYAPTNQAFLAAGLTADSLNKLTPSQVSYLMLYHLINPTSIPLTPITTKDMVAQNSFARTTQLGQSFYNGKYKDSFYVNGFSIQSPDNKVSNGMVHVLTGVLMPPVLRGNVQTILSNTGQNALFIAALQKANRWTALGTTSVFTVLAPNDDAMNAAGLSATAIAAATTGRIDTLVRYHMFSGSRLFTNDFGDKVSPGTLLGNTKTITASNWGRTFKGQGSVATANAVQANILGTNGVVHVINSVLRP